VAKRTPVKVANLLRVVESQKDGIGIENDCCCDDRTCKASAANLVDTRDGAETVRSQTALATRQFGEPRELTPELIGTSEAGGADTPPSR
jgi:hypothetical protein